MQLRMARVKGERYDNVLKDWLEHLASGQSCITSTAPQLVHQEEEHNAQELLTVANYSKLKRLD